MRWQLSQLRKYEKVSAVNSKYELTSLLDLVPYKKMHSQNPNGWVTFLMMHQLTLGLRSLMS